jgi:hypothetical protein
MGAWEANPTPIKAPTVVCVVETGSPNLVAIINQAALPISAQVIANINKPGSPLNRSIEMIPFLMVDVTRAPRATAPTNSVIIDRNPV